jgi:hypothetical protein
MYLFVDTPGLDDPKISNADILREIARLLSVVKDSVTFAGVLYVHPVNIPFSEETKKGLLFLEAFCGLDYAPHITFVTTKWDSLSTKQIKKSDELVNELIKSKWARFRKEGANLYHHGRCYENGEPTLDVLDLEDEPIPRQKTARERIAHLHPFDREYSLPLIVQELRANAALENTTVWKLLGMKVWEFAAASPQADNSRQAHEQASEAAGFDWTSALVSLMMLPIDVIRSVVATLWIFIKLLKFCISSVMGISNISMSIYCCTPQVIEVLIVLPGGLRFIVGRSTSGLYWRPWSSQDGSEQESDADDDISERPEYRAFAEAFGLALSMQGDTVQEPMPSSTEESSGGFWDWCVVM